MRFVTLLIIVVLSASARPVLHAQPNANGLRASERTFDHKDPKDDKKPKHDKTPKDNKDPKSVPEPATMLLLGAAAAGFAGVRKLRQRKNAR